MPPDSFFGSHLHAGNDSYPRSGRTGLSSGTAVESSRLTAFLTTLKTSARGTISHHGVQRAGHTTKRWLPQHSETDHNFRKMPKYLKGYVLCFQMRKSDEHKMLFRRANLGCFWRDASELTAGKFSQVQACGSLRERPSRMGGSIFSALCGSYLQLTILDFGRPPWRRHTAHTRSRRLEAPQRPPLRGAEPGQCWNSFTSMLNGRLQVEKFLF